MIDLSRAPVIRILLPYAGGSLAASLGIVTVRPVEVLIVSALAGVTLVLLCIFHSRKLFSRRPLVAPLLFLLNLWAGIGHGVADRPHDPGLPVNKELVVSGRVIELSHYRQDRIVVELDLFTAVTPDTVCYTRTRVKAILAVPPDAVYPVPGETWMITGKLSAITSGGNPGEVDYASIMKRKNCWYRLYGDTKCEVAMHPIGSPIRGGGAAGIRRRVRSYWNGPGPVVQLLGALCLGERSGLSEDLLQSYSRAGGMHVLAVSGLHVGLIWWVLHRLFSVFVRLTGREISRVAMITILLWFYAWLTGFSSSVCRSVGMFTLFSLSRLISQRGPPVNVILVSMFFMLVIHPGRMLDVGFQLSYAAVLAIVTMHPLFSRMIRVKNRVLKWAWEATGVSLAAQLGTLPLVIHYFHQVPLYALLTNLLVLPLLSGIIALFVISVPFMASGVATGLFNSLLMILGGWMNRIMEIIATLPGSVIDRLSLNSLATILCLTLVFLGIAMLKHKGSLYKTGFMFTLGLLFFWGTISHGSDRKRKQAVVANFYACSLVTFSDGPVVDHYIWNMDTSSLAYIDRYLETAWERRSSEVSVMLVQGEDPLYGGISICCPIGSGEWLVGNNSARGLVISGSPDGKALKILSGIQADFLLLSGEPYISKACRKTLFHLSGNLVADGSNRKWYTDQLQEFAGQAHISRERGAYLLHY